MRKKKVLMVFYGFPPAVEGATQRKAKFVKYLPSYGWVPIVLTVKTWGFPFYDYGILKDLPAGLKICRTPSFEPVRLFSGINRLFKRKTPQSNQVMMETQRRMSLIGKTKDMLYKWMFIPDSRIGWLPFAVFSGWRIIKNEGVDVILSSSAPITCHLIAYILKKITYLPWVADFRDPWTQNILYPYKGQFREKIDRYLENRILSFCDRIIANTPGNKEDLIQEFELPDEKVEVITNGFDPSDFPKKVLRNKKRFIILHSGSIYTVETLKGFFNAIDELHADRPELEGEMQVVFRTGFEGINQSILRRLTSSPIFHLEKSLPYRQNLADIMKAGLLVITLPPGARSCIPGKLYEYLYTKRPILALVPEGDCADLVRKTKTGVVVDPDDSDRIAAVIYDFYQKWKRGELTVEPNWDLIKQFERKNLTAKLAQVLEKCTERKK